MKINKEQIESSIDFFEEYFDKYVATGSWRKGQFLWNFLNNWFPDITEPLRRSNTCDPYYLDERIPAFMEAICDEEALQEWYSNEFVIKNFTI